MKLILFIFPIFLHKLSMPKKFAWEGLPMENYVV